MEEHGKAGQAGQLPKRDYLLLPLISLATVVCLLGIAEIGSRLDLAEAGLGFLFLLGRRLWSARPSELHKRRTHSGKPDHSQCLQCVWIPHV